MLDYGQVLELLTDDERQVQATARDFLDTEAMPGITDAWEKGEFPKDLIPKLGKMGYLGANLPSEYGTAGVNNMAYGLLMYELERVDSGLRSFASVQGALVMYPIYSYGSEEQKQNYLPKMAAGEMIGCFGLTEHEGGSDPGAMKTTARKDGESYILNGSKMWITNSPKADFICLLANTSDDKPHVNKSLIVVPKDAGGITVDKPLNKLGMRSSETAQVFFDDVRVPQRNLIGQEGMGFMMQMMQFQEERLWGAANAIKGCENLIAQTIDYARERQVFGMSLLDNQSVHFKLAELQTEVEMLRALVWQACETYINGGDVLRLASMAKLKAGRLSREVADGCMQYWGGNGSMWDNPASQLYRDGRLGSIGGGADEVMLGIICKTMGMLPGKKKNS